MSITGELWKAIADRMLAVQAMTDLSHAERTVLSVLAWHDGEKCCPALSTIAKTIGCSELWVRDLLKSARAKGRITWTRRRRESSLYTINYAEPIVDCGQSPRSRDSRVRGIPALKNRFLIAGNPREELKDFENNGKSNGGPTGKSTAKQRLDSQRTNTPKQRRGQKETATIEGNGAHEENQMDGYPYQHVLGGFCRECGYGVPAKAPACPTCGSEVAPFVCSEAELKTGVIALPFGVHATGLDSAKGRLLFLSEEGQSGLREAYAVIFGDKAPEGMTQ